MSKLLINESPVMIIPTLAMKLGLNEAVVLQQIHYWLVQSSHVIKGRKWIYNTYKDWQKQLPFWSESTIKRTIKSLEDQGYLVSANWNRSKMDKTKWYAIEYGKLEELEESACLEQSSGHDEPSDVSESYMEEVEVDLAIPETTTKTSTDIYIPFTEIIKYLNDRTNTSYKAANKKTKKLIQARWKEGFTLADFKKVIDLKAAEWMADPHWCKYLRPETLFGAKFESYRNQKVVKKIIREEDFDLND